MTFGNTMPKVRMQTASLRMNTTFSAGFICLNGTPSCFGFSMSNPHSGQAVYDMPPVAPLRQADCAGMRLRGGGLLQHAPDRPGKNVLAVRLGDIAVRAEPESPADVVGVALCREHHDRQHGVDRVPAHLRQEIEAIAVEIG